MGWEGEVGSMKALARSLVVVMVALIAVPALVVTTAVTTAVQLLATTVLVLGGTGHSLAPGDDPVYVGDYMGWAMNHFIDTDANLHADPGHDYGEYGVVYPAEFFPVSGTTTFEDSVAHGVDNLSACLGRGGECNYSQHDANDPPTPSASGQPPFVVFGYSQSAVVASLVKNDLIADRDPALNGTQFFLISNPMRANGGILGRGFEGMTIPLMGIPFYGPTQNSCAGVTCGAGDTYQLPTTDVAQEYDFLGGDAPARPLNMLAMANSMMAYALLHGNVPAGTDMDTTELIDQGQYGDTHYYMIPSDTVPILLPLVTAGVPAAALAIPNELLKVWINDAYVRDRSPGEHVTFQLSPIGNPISLIGNTLGAVPVGIDTTVEGFTTPGNRPLGTDPSGPYGVGGPPAPIVNGPTTTLARTGDPELAVAQQQQRPERSETADTGNIGKATDDVTATTPAIKPRRPVQQLRDSITKFVPKPPSQLSNKRPLSGIVNRLTGQKPKQKDDAGDGAGDADPGKGAAA